MVRRSAAVVYCAVFRAFIKSAFRNGRASNRRSAANRSDASSARGREWNLEKGIRIYICIHYTQRGREREKNREVYNVEKKSVEEFLVVGRRRIIHHRQTFVRIAGHASHTVIDEHVRCAYTRVYDRGRK